MELDDDYVDDMLEKADNLNKEAKERPCILDCDSPSYPPETDEYRQCGCSSCFKEWIKRLKEE
jgi:hypothetical protein